MRVFFGLIMISAQSDFNSFVFDFVHQSIFSDV